ncbi:Na+/H+ antiporter subunit E [Pannonibacter carbonis]|uniref:Na+/H+ antiporter subunit E n=1 Tax=Pannonibacter carbonis TaxID=2067569 RepID=UPI000D0FFEF8|nr:Na+/H+ antiporter subunit E [Pannonibacter carbonis]
MTGLFLVNILLALSWAAVTGSFSVVNLAFGFVLGTGVLFMIREQVGGSSYFKRTGRVVGLILLFLKELALSAWRVALLVSRPKLDVSPGIIAFPLTVERDFEIALLANLITLTPGTLSVDVSEDRKVLYVHCIDLPDPEATIADIRDGFERKIMEAFR